MTLRFAGALERLVVVRATDLVAELVARPEVAAAWTRASSCAGLTVGGLTWHLVGQPVNVVRLLRAEQPAPAEADLIEVIEHYARAAWVREDHEGDANRGIRDQSNVEAEAGVDAAVVALVEARSGLESALADAPATTYIPWQEWSLATDDFLVTRLMEMVVHADDLAVSVDLSPPDFGPAVLDPVFRLLTAVAVRRHGQHALVRTLTRPQRAPTTVSAF